MIKPLAATVVAFALLIGAAANAAHAAPDYGFSMTAGVTNPFKTDGR